MKTNPYQPLKTLALAGLLAGAFASACSADTIYQDTFARGATGAIVGSAPTTDNSGLGATWSAATGGATGYTSDGTNCSVGNTYFDGINLPLDWANFADPKVQADVIFTTSRSDLWIELVLGNCDYWSSGQTAVLKLGADGHAYVISGGSWGYDTNIDCGVVGVPGGYNRLRIDYSNTLGTASFFLNGNALAQNVPINNWWSKGVGFNYDGYNSTTITNFLVSYGSEVTFPPSISTQPRGETVFVGDSVSVSMQAAGTLPLTYTWYKDGVALPGHNANTFTIPAGAQSDSGNYRVRVSNSYGPPQDSDVVRVDVHLEADTPMVQVNYDDFATDRYNYWFSYCSDNTLTFPDSTSTVTPGAGVGGSNGLVISVNDSTYADNSVTYSGIGGGSACNVSKPPTHNPNFYILSFSARIANLLETVTNITSCRAAVSFMKPDNTIVFKVEKAYTFGSNWLSAAFNLSSGDYVSGTSPATFEAGRTSVDHVQMEFTVDHTYDNYTPGPDCLLVLDNLKLTLRQSPPISATANGSQAVIHWDDPNVILQGAVDVTGPYLNIGGASAPYPVPGNSPYHFFRTSFQPVP